MFNQNQSINSGFAVDVWRPTHFGTGIDAFTHSPVGNIFAGIDVDVAVRDTDAFLYRVGYNITLLGKIVFLIIPKVLFQSDFAPTKVGNPPSTTQAVSTAKVEGPDRSVIVVQPFLIGAKWVQISRPIGPDIASFLCILTEGGQQGVYTFSADVLMHPGGQAASITFETPTQGFLHLDFMPNDMVRFDDTPGTEFGSFPRNQPFHIDVTLTVGPQTGVRVVLSGGASGDKTYTMSSNSQFLAQQFSQVRIFATTMGASALIFGTICGAIGYRDAKDIERLRAKATATRNPNDPSLASKSHRGLRTERGWLN